MLNKLSVGVALVLGAGLFLHLSVHRSAPAVVQAQASDVAALAPPASNDRKVRIVYPAPYTSVSANQASSRDGRQGGATTPVTLPSATVLSSPEVGTSTISQPVVEATATQAEPAVEPTPAVAMDANGRTPGSFDINAASVDALDHIDGGGRIGRAIASHRPYHSVDDLVRKRVLRKDVFERIKGQLAAN